MLIEHIYERTAEIYRWIMLVKGGVFLDFTRNYFTGNERACPTVARPTLQHPSVCPQI